MTDMDLVTLVGQGAPGTALLPLVLRRGASPRASYSTKYWPMLSNLLWDMLGCLAGAPQPHAPFLTRGWVPIGYG